MHRTTRTSVPHFTSSTSPLSLCESDSPKTRPTLRDGPPVTAMKKSVWYTMALLSSSGHTPIQNYTVTDWALAPRFAAVHTCGVAEVVSQAIRKSLLLQASFANVNRYSKPNGAKAVVITRERGCQPKAGLRSDLILLRAPISATQNTNTPVPRTLGILYLC